MPVTPNPARDWKDADEFTLDMGGSIRKSVVIWAHYGSSVWPVAYIARPKWMPAEDFAGFIGSLEMRVTK